MPRVEGLYYEIHGPEQAPPLLLSSGLGGSAAYWNPNLAALARKFRVITYDHRGTGRSGGELPAHYTVAHMAQDMALLLDQLGIAQAHVMGHAAGGIAALQLALQVQGRIKSVVVVNGWIKADPHFLRCFEARLALLRHAGPAAFLRAQPIFLYPAPWISKHHAQLEDELPHQLAHFPDGAIMEARIAALAAFDITQDYQRLNLPLLAIAARDDMLVPYPCSDPLATLPRAKIVHMTSGGHACNITEPAAFGGYVLEFLAHQT